MQDLDFRRKRRQSGSKKRNGTRGKKRRITRSGLHFEGTRAPLHFAQEKPAGNRISTRDAVIWAVEILIVCMAAVFLVAAFGQRVSTAGDSMSPALKN